MMRGNSHVWKKWVRRGILAVLAADAVLVLVSVQLARATPETLRQQNERLTELHKLYAADVSRVKAIEQRLPAVQRECDRFFAEHLLGGDAGYVAVVADLSEVAGKAGLRASAVNFRQRELSQRGVVEVSVATAVEGDYPGLVRFINGLERSKNFYLIESLALTSGTGGGIKLSLQLKTYFRS